MEKIKLDCVIEVWIFQLNNIWFEVQLFNNKERSVKSIFKEDDKEVTFKERETINEWIRKM